MVQHMRKSYYLGDMTSCYGGASAAVSARIGSVWKRFWELRGVKLYCCEMWELTVPDEVRLHGVENHIIRMCGIRLVNLFVVASFSK